MSESIMDQIVETPAMSGNAKILVVGVGGGGCNAVQNMIDIGCKRGYPPIPFICAYAVYHHKQHRKNDSRQSGTEVEPKADGTGNYGNGKLPQQRAAYLFVFQQPHHASTLYPIPRTV